MECTWDATLLQRSAELPSELVLVIQHGGDTQYLNAVTKASLDPRYTYLLFAHCDSLSAHICATLQSYGSLSSALATLGRIVPFAPFLMPYAEHLLAEEYDFGTSDDSAEDLMYLLGLFRLFSFEPRSLKKFIRPKIIASLLESSSRPIVYLAIRILQIYYHGADHWFEQMVQLYLGEDIPESTIDGAWDDRVIDYRFLTLWEEDRLRRVRKLMEDVNSVSRSHDGGNVRVLRRESFDESTVLIGGILLPRNDPGSDLSRSTTINLVQTSTISNNLRAIASALRVSKPLLIEGLSGAGKTLLTRHVAQSLGKLEQMVTLHLNQQSDAKLLMGVYTTGPTPGSFVWKPGVLTTAVQEGRWILIEDLERAPDELIGALLPLIEKGQLMIPSRKEVINAQPGFRIIATARTSTNHRGQTSSPITEMLGLRHWQRVSLQIPETQELQQITGQLYPALSGLLPQLHKLYERLHTSWQSITVSRRERTGTPRTLSPRDLLKLCDRVSILLHTKVSLTSNDMDNMFLESMDCFAGSIPNGQARTDIAGLVAEELRIDPRRRDYLLDQREVQYRAKDSHLNIGRYHLERSLKSRSSISTSFSTNPHTNRMLEKVTGAVINQEPLLLVGETGVGKTAAVQHLATHLGKKLVPFNLSQQSEAGDLLGGFKPVNARSLFVPMKDEFDDLFSESFSLSKNQQFLELLGKQTSKSNWKAVCKLWQQALKMVDQHRTQSESRAGEAPSKKRKVETKKNIDFVRWDAFAAKVTDMERRLASGSDGFAFSFVEGNIVKALRNGDWILLDEINLASSDTLESIADLFDPIGPSILLDESGSIERIEAHPSFRVFAAMNPANDVGKKDLPPGIRSRFTELYVESPDNDIKSLTSIVRSYLRHEIANDQAMAMDVSKLYQSILQLAAQNKLVDGAGTQPHFSLRTLTRTLSYAKYIAPFCSLRRALYEGFQMSFMTFLDTESSRLVQPLVEQSLFGKRTNLRAELQKALRKPSEHHVQGYPSSKHWVQAGQSDIEEQPHYILTPFILSNLENLVRATSTRQFPVLIQGPTSSGKTSMIEYLAKRTGHRFIRINNHEHTDLQEYLGTYVSGVDGRLQFQDGILVNALREGHWLVLDELNLAPSDVLEALNRLLDDNRELLIPETQEVIRPHQDFMLFATQNPAGLYGGRKTLSRAFRNRFLELHFDDIPIDELQEILHRRTQLPESRCKRIVSVYRELSVLRQENRLFEQKSFATLRDLFRWAQRPNDTIEQLAANGFMLLSERVRKPDERQLLKDTIERVMSEKVVSSDGRRINIDDAQLYSETCPEVMHYERNVQTKGVVWTKAMRRLYVLVARALANNEPVLLVGETGCGKTTVCQMLADALGKMLHSVNAHQNTEIGDLIGSQRPLRNRAVIEANLRHELLSSALLRNLASVSEQPTDDLLSYYDQAFASPTKERRSSHSQSPENASIQAERTRYKALFEWVDGSLVQAMKEGSFFLLDEISLADDSVLERINSVLESQRTILLAEKGSIDSNITAAPGFQFLATMNPGGDFGKRELSPALRNRFTEIWVPPLDDMDDVIQILHAKLIPDARSFVPAMVGFAQWFRDRYNTSATSSISIRDALSWASFVNECSARIGIVSAVVNGASMVYNDTLGANPAGLMAMSTLSIDEERKTCIDQLSVFLNVDCDSILTHAPDLEITSDTFKVEGFSLPRIAHAPQEVAFSFHPATTRINTLRVVRALQLPKPIMLEGNPGVGKTALVTAIAGAIGIPLTRINLSEQTDLIDLFGSDIPLEGAETGNFAWRDAPFLRAMKNGEWVLLDEMNLASQSVLEGLNACLDHRGEVFVPELGQTFSRHPDFKLFAAQNPHHQGGGRKGLPASFVNRFTVVYADAFRPDDLKVIAHQSYPMVDVSILDKIIAFVHELDLEIARNRRFAAKGAPWEFNYRDIARLLALATSDHALLKSGSTQDFIDLLFSQRFRSDADRALVGDMFHLHFGEDSITSDLFSTSSSTHMQLGLSILPKCSILSHFSPVKPGFPEAGNNFRALQSVMLCVQHNWPVILVGRSGVGKTRLLERLAATIGTEIATLAINAETDAMDLIGGFEQTDSDWHTKQTQRSLREGNNMNTLRALQTSSKFTGHSVLPAPETQAAQDANTATKPTFEWIDGILVDALREGKWLVLDNANLCSPSVLDRLNSLLEPNGVLIVNERNNADGSPQIIKPHPDFRIFLTVNHRYGELSRAMRNRAVELYIADPESAGPSLGLDPCFSEAAVSRLRSIQVLADLANGNTASDHVICTMFDHLSAADQPLLDRFVRQIFAGLYELPQAAVRGLETALRAQQQPQFKAIEGPVQLHEAALSQTQVPADFLRVQTFHPLNNQSLIQFSHKSAALAPCVAFVYDCGVQLQYISDLLKKASSSPTLVTKLVRTERSLGLNASSSSGRSSSSSILDLGNTVLHQLARCLKSLLSEPVSDLIKIKIFLHRLVAIVISLVESLLEGRLDGVDLNTLLAVGREVTTSHGIVTTAAAFQSSVTAIQHSLDTALATTGYDGNVACATLWKTLRPSTPSNRQQFEALLRLGDIVHKFDEICRQLTLPLEQVVGLRLSFAHTIDVASRTGEGVAELATRLGEVISSGSEAITGSGNSRTPHFHQVFLQMSEHFNTLRLGGHTLPTKEQATIDIFAQLPTTASGTLSSDGNDLLRLAPCVASLVNDGTNDFTYAGVNLSLLNRLLNTDEVPLSLLGLFETEIETLGQTVSTYAHLLEEPSLISLDSCLGGLVQNVLSALELQESDVALQQAALALQQELASGTAYATNAPISGSMRSGLSIRDIGQYLRPATSYLRTDSTEEHTRLEQAANAWACFAVTCLRLYVPSRPFDPALESRFKNSLYMWQHDDLVGRLQALQMLRKRLTSEKNCLRATHLQQDIRSLGSAPEIDQVYRPAASQISDLQLDFDALLRILHSLKVDNEQITFGLPLDLTTISNLAKLRRRLATQYRAYWDFVSPVVGFIDCLFVAQRLAFMAKAKARSESEGTKLSTVLPFVQASMDSWISDQAFVNVSSGLRSRQEVVRWLSVVAVRSAISPISTHSSELLQAISQRFDQLHQQWKSELSEERRATAEKSSLYKYRYQDAESDEASKEELEGLFPTGPLDVDDAERRMSAIRAKDDASNIARLYMGIFVPDESAASDFEKLLLDWTFSSGRHKIVDDPGLNSTLLLLLEKVRSGLSTSGREARAYNMYTDANIGQMKKLLSLIREVSQRFIYLQASWPEHATPVEVLRQCDDILEVPHSSPLPSLLPRLEKLYATVNDWQSIASREFTVHSLLTNISDLIISWRQLELSSWAGLFDREWQQCQETAASWWHVAYDTLVGTIADDGQAHNGHVNHAKDILDVLGDFIQSSGLGEYATRLRILRGFEAHMSLSITKSPLQERIKSALANFNHFYSHFEDQIAARLSQGRAKLEKEVKNIIQLASWKDRNIDVLRQSAVSSHRKLLRLVRKFRSLLAQPVSPIINEGLRGTFQPLELNTTLSNQSGAGLTSAVNSSELNVWHQRPDRFRKPGQTARLIHSKFQGLVNGLDAPSQLKAFIDEVRPQLSELQNATPSTSKEENKTLVQHLKTRKRRLLADVLKSVRKMGFQIAVSEKILHHQNSTSAILTRLSTPFSSERESKFAPVEYELHRFLSAMPTVRESARKHSDELTSAEITRCLALLESMLQVNVNSYNHMTSYLRSFEELREVFNRFRALSVSKNCHFMDSQTSSTGIVGGQTRQAYLQRAIRTAIRLLQAQESLASRSESNIVSALKEKLDTLNALMEQSRDLPKLPAGIESEETRAIEVQYADLCNDLQKDIETFASSDPETSPVLYQLQKWTNVQSSADQQDLVNGHTTWTLSEWTKELLSTYDSILTAVQHVEKGVEHYSSLPSGSWVTSQLTLLHETFDALGMEKLKERMTRSMSHLQHLSPQEATDLSDVVAVLHALQPIIESYYRSINTLLQLYGNLCARSSNTGHFLATSFTTIAQRGFCKPSEKTQDDSGEAGDVEAGTGLGDGEGAEDISKDVGDEEDLSELAQDSKRENDTSEMEQEKDAVDMADDELEGEVDGTETEGVDEEAGDGSEEEGPDVDEEAGDADLDSNAVDEKIWDGGPESKESEKEADSGKGTTRNEDVAAAEEGNIDEAEIHGDDEAEAVTGNEQESAKQEEKIDPHVEEGSNLDLPDDMGKDGDQSKEGSDADLESLSEGMADAAGGDPNMDLPDETGSPQDDNADDVSEQGLDEDQTMQGIEDQAEDGQDEDMLQSPKVQTQDEDHGQDEEGDGMVLGDDNNDSQGAQTVPRPEIERQQTQDADKMPDENEEQSGGTSGTGQKQEAGTQNPEQSKDANDRLPFKQLGDILEQWYNKHREIADARHQNEEPETRPDQMDMEGVEFEHLPDEDATADAQAIGGASAEQSRALDEQNAIGDDDDAVSVASENDDDFETRQTEPQGHNVEEDRMEIDQPDAAAESKPPTSFVGESKQFEDQRAPSEDGLSERQSDDMDDVEDQLTKAHISHEDTANSLTLSEAQQLWSKHEDSSRNLSLILTEHLRLILQPTQATKMRGDFRTGKRLNIKRIIPYIASSYKRDKIWMRRSTPTKRSYQIMLAIDDSKSMAESRSHELAFETLALIAKSMSMLEVGELSVVGFGEDVKVAHDFSTPFTSEAGAKIFQHFTFAQTKTNVKRLLTESIALFHQARLRASGSASDLWQLQLIISDGICDDHPSIRQLVREAHEERIMIVFVVVDIGTQTSFQGGGSATTPKQSILDMPTAQFVKDENGDTELKMMKYLDTFPFRYYLIVQNIQELPQVLAGALRQWFAEVVETAN